MRNFKRSTYSTILLKHSLILGIVFVLLSCKENSSNINLKWNKAYTDDSMEKNITGLKWCLSFLGSNIASDTTLLGISHNDSIITLNINKLGFTKKAIHQLAQINQQILQSQEYQQKNSIDIGRYISLTLGSSNHYYKITDIPSNLKDYYSQYDFDSISGYIDNSSVSKVHRKIAYSRNVNGNHQAFISTETDSINEKPLEFETVEIMANGQLKFGIYDENGNLKPVASSDITNAGKPAKCIWCHETNIQPLFSKQSDIEGFLSYKDFLDSLTTYNRKLQVFQDNSWRDAEIATKNLHTEMEIAYISFMEPSVEQISREWNMPMEKVLQKVSHLATHKHEEFGFLGTLYDRKDIDKLAPWGVLNVPESIREASKNEVDYLTLRTYFDELLKNLDLASSEKETKNSGFTSR